MVPVAFDVSAGLHKLIKIGVSGLLIRPFDVDEYAAQLMTLMEDPVKCRLMSENARKYAREFDIRLIANNWIKLIDKIKYEQPKSVDNYPCL